METEIKEIWKNIQIEPYTKYKISNLGNVKGYLGLLSPKKTNGYYRVRFSHKKITKNYYIHILVATHFIHNPSNKKIVNHKNRIRNDNRVENLEWCTYSENTQHYHNIRTNKLGRPVIIKYKGIFTEFSSMIESSKIIGLEKSTIYKKCNNSNEKNFYYKNNNKIDIIEDGINIKKIYGYNFYLLNKSGDIYSLYGKNIKLLSPSKKSLYITITLHKNKKSYTELVHRLILMTFNPCKNMKNLLVNHINLNKHDNRLENLEWVNRSINTNHAFNNKKINQRAVIKYDINKNKLKEYKSIVDANKDTFDMDRTIEISKICNYKLSSIGGYIFTYKENENIFFKKLNNSKIILKYDNNNYISKYNTIKEASIDIYGNILEKNINKIRKACIENSKKCNNFIVINGYIFKYKKLPKIYKYDTNNNYISKYNTIKEASIDMYGDENTKSKEKSIRLVCIGRQKTTNNFIFKYEYE